MSEPLDFGSTMSVLYRRRRVLAASGLLGAVAGLLLVVESPPLYSSTTLVLLAPPPNNGGQVVERDMATEARIATSDAVLGRARTLVRPALGPRRIKQLVTVDSPSQSMLHITARGSTAHAAESLAEAVAASELAYEKQASSSLSNAEQAALRTRQSKLENQLATVTREIARARKLLQTEPPQSPRAGAAQTAVAQLTAQQSTLVLDIEGIKAERSARSTGPDATLVQHATPAKRPQLLVWQVVAAVLGMLVGAGLAAAVSVGLARRDRRLRTRDEIADALGTPVIGSLKSIRARTTAEWSTLLQSYRPSTVDVWSLRLVLDRIGAAPLLAAVAGARPGPKQHQLRLVLVVMAEDSGALAVAGQLASHTASLGVSTCLTTRQRHAFADPLWATGTMHDRGHELRPGLWVDPRRRKSPADLVAELVIVDRQQPVLPDLSHADAVLLIVSSGVATEDDLARVAVTSYEAGGRFRGVVVADPDSLDRTTGRLLQGERAAEPPMPMKLIGVEADEWRERNGGR